MSLAAFIGDEISAAGYRLCGVEVHVPGTDNALALIREAMAQSSLVLIGSTTARTIDPAELHKIMVTVDPPVVIVPDVRRLQDVPDIASRIYRQLGMLE